MVSVGGGRHSSCTSDTVRDTLMYIHYNTNIHINVSHVHFVLYYLHGRFWFLSCPNFAIPSNKGVNNFAFLVGTRMEEETNQLTLIL